MARNEQGLSERQYEVLKLMAKHRGCKLSVARAIKISNRTVDFHLACAYDTLKVDGLLGALFSSGIIKENVDLVAV